MIDRYLEISYRKGKPFAAYLFLARRPGDRSARTEKFSDVLVIDYAEDGRPIGIEIVHPQKATVSEINRALTHLNQSGVLADELAPLKAA